MGYDGVVTLMSGEKFRVSIHQTLPDKLLLIQGKLHTAMSQGRAKLVEFFKEMTTPVFKYDNDFPALGFGGKKKK
jgi:hypothetical protein